MPQTKIEDEKFQSAVIPKLWKKDLWFLGIALLLNEIYPSMKFTPILFELCARQTKPDDWAGWTEGQANSSIPSPYNFVVTSGEGVSKLLHSALMI